MKKKLYITRSNGVHLDNEYNQWLTELIGRYRHAQIKTAVKVNSEKLLWNWQTKRDLVRRKAEEKWGSSIVEQAASPNETGFYTRIGISHHRHSAYQKRSMLLALLIMTICFRAFANGDPVVHYSSINRVANPEPLSISEIRIVHEQVNITHIDGYNCFDITYQFKNESDKDFPEIHYGFPIDYLVADEQETYAMTKDYYSESIYETGWCNKLIKDISFRFNDHKLQFHSAKESIRQAGYEVEIYDDSEQGDSILVDGVNRRWFYTKFFMAPNSEATFNVSYKVYANSKMPLYGKTYSLSQYVRESNLPNTYISNHPLLSRHFGSEFTILYDFTPAKHFGNDRGFVLDVDIDLSNLDNPYLNIEGMVCYTSHLSHNQYVVNPGDLRPINLTVNFSPPRNKERIEHIIAPFITSSDNYDLHQSRSTIDIEFHKPTFISEWVCDLDTALIKSVNSCITYSDGSIEEYCYNLTSPAQWYNKITSPVILTITDLYHDSMGWNEKIKNYKNMTGHFDAPHFKIKKLRLNFNVSESSAKENVYYRNIRVLDSRFIK